MTQRASGSFEVQLAAQRDAEAGVGRMLIDKRFQGDLDATSVGQMLAVHGTVEGSAAYVAMECVSGRLHGRSGGFALQHRGVMQRGARSLTVTVVPDSGSGSLQGISGSMDITITDGKHFYDFDYALPEPA